MLFSNAFVAKEVLAFTVAVSESWFGSLCGFSSSIKFEHFVGEDVLLLVNPRDLII